MSKIIDKLTGKTVVCPWWLCFTFDNPLRKLLHDPKKILAPYVHPGNRVIDIGAGMGYFTIPLARLVGSNGRVVAIDLQEKMLAALSARAQKQDVAQIVETRLASPKSLGIEEKADFILAFWMLHEVPDQTAFLREIRNLVKPGGSFLLVEPKLHVMQKHFSRSLQIAEKLGFILKDRPKIGLSRSALFSIGNT